MESAPDDVDVEEDIKEIFNHEVDSKCNVRYLTSEQIALISRNKDAAIARRPAMCQLEVGSNNVRARPVADPTARQHNPAVHSHYAAGGGGPELVSRKGDEPNRLNSTEEFIASDFAKQRKSDENQSSPTPSQNATDCHSEIK